ncbi:MAG: HEPN domain-containing protein, partial [Desulfarculaceae bacterium]
VVRESDRDKLVGFWKQYWEIDPTNIAVWNFLTADYNPYDDQAILQLIQALEFLLCPGEGESIRFRFGLMASLVFGHQKNPDERKEINRRFKAIYDYRSALVHGSKKKPKKAIGEIFKNQKEGNLKSLMDELKEYVREGIRLFYEAGCLDDSGDRYKYLMDNFIFRSKINLEK